MKNRMKKILSLMVLATASINSASVAAPLSWAEQVKMWANNEVPVVFGAEKPAFRIHFPAVDSVLNSIEKWELVQELVRPSRKYTFQEPQKPTIYEAYKKLAYLRTMNHEYRAFLTDECIINLLKGVGYDLSTITLSSAVDNNVIPLVEHMLINGADINAGEDLLELALRIYDPVPMLKYLLSAGALVRYPVDLDSPHKSALGLAALKGILTPDLIVFFKRAGADFSKEPIITFFLKRVNGRDREITALGMATILESLEALVDAGADVNKSNSWFRSPLESSYYIPYQVIEFLYKNGAELQGCLDMTECWIEQTVGYIQTMGEAPGWQADLRLGQNTLAFLQSLSR